jgi:hypothetical protein
MGFGAAFGGGFRGVFAGTTRTTLVLQPDATAGLDCFVNGQDATTKTYNNGITTQIIIGGLAAANTPTRGLVQFVLSALPASLRVISANLELYCESEASTTDYVIGAHRALTQWFEGSKDAAAPSAGQDGSTWNLRNANGAATWAGGAGGGSGSDYTATATDTQTITAPTAWYIWNVATDVAAWVAGTATNYGWWLINTSENTANSRKRFTSSDGATAANRPKLTIVYEV